MKGISISNLALNFILTIIQAFIFISKIMYKKNQNMYSFQNMFL